MLLWMALVKHAMSNKGPLIIFYQLFGYKLSTWSYWIDLSYWEETESFNKHDRFPGPTKDFINEKNGVDQFMES